MRVLHEFVDDQLDGVVIVPGDYDFHIFYILTDVFRVKDCRLLDLVDLVRNHQLVLSEVYVDYQLLLVSNVAQ